MESVLIVLIPFSLEVLMFSPSYQCEYLEFSS